MNLAVFKSCYAEQTVILENALRAGHQPGLVLIFSWPGCLAGDGQSEISSALATERLPLFSHYLDDETPSRDADEAVSRWFMRHVAIARFRNYGNGWIRRRMMLVLKGRSPAIRRFRPDDREQPYPARGRTMPRGRRW